MFAGIAFVAAGRAGQKADQENGQSGEQQQPPQLEKNNVADGANKKSKKSKRNKRNKAQQQQQPQQQQNNESEGSDSEYVESTAEEDIIRLAAITGNTVKVSGVVKRTPDSPITLVPITLNEDDNEKINDADGDDEQWTRVPTKTEEIVNNLKQRIEQLSRQLQEQDDQRAKERNEQEHQQRRFKEAEHDWRERVKALVQQVSNLENELTGLRANNQYLSEQCANVVELERRSDQLMAVQERNAVLEQQLMHFEKLLRDAQSAKEAAINTSVAVRAGLEADVEQARRDYMAARQLAEQLRQDLAESLAVRASFDAAHQQYVAQLRENQVNLDLLQKRVDSLVSERDSIQSRLDFVTADNQRLDADLLASKSDAAMCKEAISFNNQYVCLLVEAEQKSFQEKSRLVQELVAVRRQLQTLAQNN